MSSYRCSMCDRTREIVRADQWPHCECGSSAWVPASDPAKPSPESGTEAEAQLPVGIENLITECIGAAMLYESYKHDLWRGDQPFKDRVAARARLVARLIEWNSETAKRAYQQGADS